MEVPGESQAPQSAEGDKQPLAPNEVDIWRLNKERSEQEQQLQAIRARVERLRGQEQRVWKDVANFQQKFRQRQEVQAHREAKQADLARERMNREKDLQEQKLRQRDQLQLSNSLQFKIEEKRAAAQQVRDQRKMSKEALNLAKDELQRRTKQLVDARREESRQQQVRKSAERAKREEARQFANSTKVNGIQADLANIKLAIAAAKREEEYAASRLQNSQSVQADIIKHPASLPGSPVSQTRVAEDFFTTYEPDHGLIVLPKLSRSASAPSGTQRRLHPA